ncbi:MAG: DNA polymerase ligase N-terminal domain-containing protein, partial [Phycisphaeraceae bacterium]|nr:DNA polymerase ligase N-terminal domain-containing protein [Phycisphaeraceae bacterium]
GPGVAELDTYRDKRDFRRTPEPRGEVGGSDDERPRFVIQQHDASTMHWDFRLEADGVLKSWAIPKGPSTNPKDKRLAVATEDHPLDYADFEGVIPEEEYGGGTVIVWDAGPYRNLKKDDQDRPVSVKKAYEQGQLEIWIEGRKLRGGYALIHSKMRGDEKNWLLVKMKDEGADARRNPTRTEPHSVLSGRTVEQVEDEEAD